jgi:hypothetical protein
MRVAVFLCELAAEEFPVPRNRLTINPMTNHRMISSPPQFSWKNIAGNTAVLLELDVTPKWPHNDKTTQYKRAPLME